MKPLPIDDPYLPANAPRLETGAGGFYVLDDGVMRPMTEDEKARHIERNYVQPAKRQAARNRRTT